VAALSLACVVLPRIWTFVDGAELLMEAVAPFLPEVAQLLAGRECIQARTCSGIKKATDAAVAFCG